MNVEARANCAESWKSQRIEYIGGEIPPGLIFNGADFTGVPDRAGTWLTQVRVVAPACQGVVYMDKDLWILFTVEEDRSSRRF